MLELFSRLSPADLAVVLTVVPVIGLGLLFIVLVAVAKLIARYHERQLATSLILEMLDRGMSADDIVRVLSAAGLEDRREELLSLRQRLRQKLSRLLSAPAKPSPRA
jgi:Mg/Co/Ni transporter MgtE